MDPGPPLLPFPGRVATTRLRCGMPLVTVESPHLHGASVALFVRVGSRYERAKQNGLSHFVEHMLFRGCEKFPDSFALNQAIEERCGMLSGETGRDYSLYQVTLHPQDLGEALFILGDLFTHPCFSDIELERAIVLEEILDDFDETGQRINIDDVSRKIAFPHHPLGFPITGPEENIRRFSKSDVIRHFRTYHGGRNMVLAVAGPITPRRVQELAEKSFVGLAKGSRQTALPAPKTFRGGKLEIVRTDSSQVEIQFVFRALPDRHPDYPALVTLLRVLDDGMSTRLHYRICDRKGLAYHVNAGLDSLGDLSLVEVTATCAPQKLPELTSEVLAILHELRTVPASDLEIAKVKRRYARDMEVGFDDVEGLATFYGGNLLFDRPLRTPAERQRRMDRVSAEKARSVAQRIFQAKNLVTTLVGSIPGESKRKIRRLLQSF